MISKCLFVIHSLNVGFFVNSRFSSRVIMQLKLQRNSLWRWQSQTQHPSLLAHRSRPAELNGGAA